MIRKEAFVILFVILSWDLTGSTEENYETSAREVGVAGKVSAHLQK
jgi:hypothetical protein